MLTIENLQAEVDGKPILKGLSLAINAGEIHAIMGPNGAGKSTLAYTLGGRPGYEVTGGSVVFASPRHCEEQSDEAIQSSARAGGLLRSARNDEGAIDLLALAPHERAAAGLFLGFQYPVEIPGVSNVQFLREALNSQRKLRGEAPLSAADLPLAREKAALLGMDMDMMKRAVNVGFSGGEKKRAEMVHMGILNPRLAILDETDSASISMHSRPWAPASTRSCAPPTRPCCSSPIISACSTMCSRISYMSWPTAASSSRAAGARQGAGARGLCGGDRGVNALAPLPTRKDEAWRYSDLDAVARAWPLDDQIGSSWVPARPCIARCCRMRWPAMSRSATSSSR